MIKWTNMKKYLIPESSESEVHDPPFLSHVHMLTYNNFILRCGLRMSQGLGAV